MGLPGWSVEQALCLEPPACSRRRPGRLQRNPSRIGGAAVGLTSGQLTEIVDELDRIERDSSELESIIVSNASLTDRLETTGVLTERTAWDHAVVGVVGRASGLDQDIRRDRPFAAYGELQVRVVTYRYGDVRARMRVCMDEIHESIRVSAAPGRNSRGPVGTA